MPGHYRFFLETEITTILSILYRVIERLLGIWGTTQTKFHLFPVFPQHLAFSKTHACVSTELDRSTANLDWTIDVYF